MNALTLLENDHKKMRKLLEELESTTERGIRTREELYSTSRASCWSTRRSRKRSSTRP